MNDTLIISIAGLEEIIIECYANGDKAGANALEELAFRNGLEIDRGRLVATAFRENIEADAMNGRSVVVRRMPARRM